MSEKLNKNYKNNSIVSLTIHNNINNIFDLNNKDVQ